MRIERRFTSFNKFSFEFVVNTMRMREISCRFILEGWHHLNLASVLFILQCFRYWNVTDNAIRYKTDKDLQV